MHKSGLQVECACDGSGPSRPMTDSRQDKPAHIMLKAIYALNSDTDLCMESSNPSADRHNLRKDLGPLEQVAMASLETREQRHEQVRRH